jgi:SNF2 family DNA or RNA helicase
LIELWAHQHAAVDQLAPLGRGGLWFEMGAGKTRAALALAVDHWDCRKVLVICPKAVVRVWPKELLACGLSDWQAYPLDTGTGAKRAAQVELAGIAADVYGERVAVILNYEATIREPMTGALTGHDWDLVVLDEAHRIKAPEGAASLVAARICSRAKHVLCLTGTPMPHGPLDVWAQFRSVAPEVLPETFAEFKARYAVTNEQDIRARSTRKWGARDLAELNALPVPMTGEIRAEATKRFGPRAVFQRHQGVIEGRAAEEWVGVLGERAVSTFVSGPKFRHIRDRVKHYQREEELAARIDPWVYRVRTREVLDLPAERDVERVGLLGGKARAIYQQLEDELVAAIGTGEVTAANEDVKLLRLAQVVQGYAIDSETGETVHIHDAKASLLADLLDDLDAEEPLVVFGRFHEDLDAIARVCDKAGRSHLELSGRRNELAAWQAGEADVLIVQLQAGAEGNDFTRARVQVYYALYFNAGSYRQTRARIMRPGQTQDVTYVHLVCAGTVDDIIYEVLRKREELVQGVLRRLGRRGKAA